VIDHHQSKCIRDIEIMNFFHYKGYEIDIFGARIILNYFDLDKDGIINYDEYKNISFLIKISKRL
jgi:hypothetical protein